MNSKDRLLTALQGGKPDRLPVTVHQWQVYHLDTVLGGISDMEAFEIFGMDAAIQYVPDMGQFWLPDADFAKFSSPEWRDEVKPVNSDHSSKDPHLCLGSSGVRLLTVRTRVPSLFSKTLERGVGSSVCPVLSYDRITKTERERTHGNTTQYHDCKSRGRSD